MDFIVVLHVMSRHGHFIALFFFVTFNEHLKNFDTLNKRMMTLDQCEILSLSSIGGTYVFERQNVWNLFE